MHHSIEVSKACEILINSMLEDNLKNDLNTPWSKEELAAVKRLTKLRTSATELSLEAAMSEIKALLKINNRTINTF